jgi:hypothetical protein
MSNIKTSISLVDGSGMDLETYTGDQLIYRLAGDDYGPPISFLRINASTSDGKKIKLAIPNDDGDVWIELEEDSEEIKAIEESKIRSTSKSSAECDEIILKQTDRVRLIFKPTIVENPKNKEACVKGVFIYQRKSKNNLWTDQQTTTLAKVKQGEIIKFPLHSAELLRLIQNLQPLYSIYVEHGIPRGQVQYLKVQGSFGQLAKLNTADLKKLIDLEKEDGLKVFTKLLQYVTKIENSPIVADKLYELDVKDLEQLNSIIGLTNLKKCYKIWENNLDNDNEDFWQKKLMENSFILSQIFASPVVVIDEKVYLGGKSIQGKGGSFIDFLLKNNLTNNSVLVEIKTPCTKLLGGLYRGDIFNISKDISGGVLQLSNYKNKLTKNYASLIEASDRNFEVCNPKCVLIIGNGSIEFTERKMNKSFELHRNGLSDVQIITFDELFAKVKFFIDLLEGKIS